MNTAAPCHYHTLDTALGPLEIEAGEAAIRAVRFVEAPRHPQSDSALLREAAAQLEAYFAGRRQHFELPLAPRGTPFQLAVWEALRELDYGATASYRDIAERVGRPSAVRAVGAANGRNPLVIVVPCHRVVGARGALTGYAGGLERKAWLLRLEQAAILA